MQGKNYHKFTEVFFKLTLNQILLLLNLYDFMSEAMHI